MLTKSEKEQLEVEFRKTLKRLMPNHMYTLTAAAASLAIEAVDVVVSFNDTVLADVPDVDCGPAPHHRNIEPDSVVSCPHCLKQFPVTFAGP